MEYLIDSINCPDSALQVALGLSRPNTNSMKTDFELAGLMLIEVDPYRRSQMTPVKPGGANISVIDFSAGRGSSGVDLRWHHPKDFKALSNEHKDELCAWQKTANGENILD